MEQNISSSNSSSLSSPSLLLYSSISSFNSISLSLSLSLSPLLPLLLIVLDDLELHDDVPSIPEQYKYVVVDGAMYYAYQFRGDTQAAQMAFNKFEQGIKHLRSIHINRTQYIRDTRVQPSTSTNGFQ